ncbi:MAG: hypothetical protein V9E98_06575 [Candidatus Nanopelagicales bacterium]
MAIVLYAVIISKSDISAGTEADSKLSVATLEAVMPNVKPHQWSFAQPAFDSLKAVITFSEKPNHQSNKVISLILVG